MQSIVSTIKNTQKKKHANLPDMQIIKLANLMTDLLKNENSFLLQKQKKKKRKKKKNVFSP